MCEWLCGLITIAPACIMVAVAIIFSGGSANDVVSTASISLYERNIQITGTLNKIVGHIDRDKHKQ